MHTLKGDHTCAAGVPQLDTTDPQRARIPTHRHAQNTHIGRQTHETHNHTLPRPMCTHTYTLIHRRQPRDPHLGLHTQTLHTRSHTPTRQRTESRRTDIHTRRTHIQAFTHLLHSDTPGDSVETRTHSPRHQHSRHLTMSVYTHTYAHTHPTPHDRTQTHPDPHGHVPADTHMQLHSHIRGCPHAPDTHTRTQRTHPDRRPHDLRVAHTRGHHTPSRPPPRGWTVRQTRARGRPRPTRTHKVTRGRPAPAASPHRAPAGPAEPAPRRAARAVTCGRPPARGLRPPSPPPSRRPAQEGRERARRRGRGRGRGEGTS